MTHTLTGRTVLYWLLGFFGVIIAVNVWFIIASIQTFSGEDEQKPYLQGIEYNQTLARRAEQVALGWRATISTRRLAGGKVRVSVNLMKADGTPETGLALHGELRHPADEELDRTLRLKETAPGTYQTEISGVHSGAWDVVVETGDPQPPFEATRRLWVS
jgi:nitrogen fixation protein FixH